MTLKQLRRLAAENGHTGREPADLRPRLPDDFPNESKRNPKTEPHSIPKQQTSESSAGSCECSDRPPLFKK